MSLGVVLMPTSRRFPLARWYLRTWISLTLYGESHNARTFSKFAAYRRIRSRIQKDLEYAVRLFVHTYEEFPRRRDVQEFLDQAILKVMSEHECDDVVRQIGWSGETLHRLFRDRA